MRLVLCATLLLLSASARAETQPAITGVRVGFAGHYRVGFWTPVEVTLRGGERSQTVHLAFTVPDGDGISTRVETGPIEIPANADTRATACIRFGNVASNLEIEVYDSEATLPIASRTFTAGSATADVEFHEAFPSTQGLLLSIGSSIGLEEVVGRSRDNPERINLVNLADATQLPDVWIGYEGVDKLIIGPSPARLEEALADRVRLDALDRWLTQGGQLILVLADDSEQYLAGDKPLARYLPGRFNGRATLSRTTSLEMFGGTYGGAPLHWARGKRRVLDATRLADVKGHVDLAEGDFPLLVRGPYAFGSVTFLAVDLSQSPLVDWPGRALAVKRLLGQRTKGDSKEDLDMSVSTGAHLGLVDLSAQLRGTLEQFSSVRLAPFWAIAGLATIYIVLVGPVDFLLLKTLLRRMEWTWITFPLLVLIFCGAAGWMAYRLKGDRLLVNQIDLVDVDLASQQVRGTTWFNVFSPATSTYDLSLDQRVGTSGNPQSRETILSWQGLPGNVLGGMEGLSTPATVGRAYDYAPDRSALGNVPIPVWSTKNFIGRWRTEAGSVFEADLKSGRDEVVHGKLVNRLDTSLKDCLLVAGRWAWQIAELKPNEPVRIEAGEQRDLVALLKDFKLVEESDRKQLVQVATPYNQASFDVRSILQQMMFYDAANGRSYTGLLNRYQSYLDSSSHIDFGQAILFGQADQPAAAIYRDGLPLEGADDQHSTYYRFIISLK